jgi:hypothetical protein
MSNLLALSSFTGYTGKNCESNIDDCLPGVCPPASTCIDLTNDFYCRCPFNLTGEDCRWVDSERHVCWG